MTISIRFGNAIGPTKTDQAWAELSLEKKARFSGTLWNRSIPILPKIVRTQKGALMEYGQLHHVEYYVNDLPRTKEFWGWFLPKMGYTEYQKFDSGISYAHKNKTYLVFVQVEPEYTQLTNNRQAAGLNHIALQGGTPADLKRLAEELVQKNIKILVQRDDAMLALGCERWTFTGDSVQTDSTSRHRSVW